MLEYDVNGPLNFTGASKRLFAPEMASSKDFKNTAFKMLWYYTKKVGRFQKQHIIIL